MAGFIKLYRKITENWVWDDRPYSRGQAWVDLLLCANHSQVEISIDGMPFDIERGERYTSEVKLADRWGWSRKKVHVFLSRLEMDKMLTTKRHNKGTVVTIINYSVYNDYGTAEEQQKSSKRTAEEQQKHTNKNEKNIDTKINLPESPEKRSSFRGNPEADAWSRYYEELNQYHDKKKRGEKPPYPVKPGETFEEAQRNRYGGIYEQSESTEAEIGTGKNP